MNRNEKLSQYNQQEEVKKSVLLTKMTELEKERKEAVRQVYSSLNVIEELSDIRDNVWKMGTLVNDEDKDKNNNIRIVGGSYPVVIREHSVDLNREESYTAPSYITLEKINLSVSAEADSNKCYPVSVKVELYRSNDGDYESCWHGDLYHPEYPSFLIKSKEPEEGEMLKFDKILTSVCADFMRYTNNKSLPEFAEWNRERLIYYTEMGWISKKNAVESNFLSDEEKKPFRPPQPKTETISRPSLKNRSFLDKLLGK